MVDGDNGSMCVKLAHEIDGILIVELGTEVTRYNHLLIIQ